MPREVLLDAMVLTSPVLENPALNKLGKYAVFTKLEYQGQCMGSAADASRNCVTAKYYFINCHPGHCRTANRQPLPNMSLARGTLSTFHLGKDKRKKGATLGTRMAIKEREERREREEHKASERTNAFFFPSPLQEYK